MLSISEFNKHYLISDLFIFQFLVRVLLKKKTTVISCTDIFLICNFLFFLRFSPFLFVLVGLSFHEYVMTELGLNKRAMMALKSLTCMKAPEERPV
jgi:hypothetical protein